MILPAILLSTINARKQSQPWFNSSLAPSVRAWDIVHEMTTDEEIDQMLNSAPAIPRLGLPAYKWDNESLHGVVPTPGNVTIYPQCIGLGASFNPAAIHKMGIAISDEERARWNDEKRAGSLIWNQGLDSWAPNINIVRDPRWGRNQETYGEDPYLTGQMAIAYITGLQGDDPLHLKTISTPKHYAVHSGPDPIRYGFNVNLTPRQMFLTFLPAFQDAITLGDAWSIMGAYSGINGIPDCASKYLLDTVLRKRWGFNGYVVSDCDAISCITYNHHYTKTMAEGAQVAIQAGCDLDCGDAYKYLHQALDQGLITRVDLDRSVERLMEARVRLGMFDQHTQWDSIPMSVVNSPAHRALARKLGDESMVLLKNQGGLLPLSPHIKTIAVVGPNSIATETLLGNYHGDNDHVVSIAQGIKNAVGPHTRVLVEKGCDIESISQATVIPANDLKLEGHYFANQDLTGEPSFSRKDKTIDFNWAESPKPGFPQTHFSVRWNGTLHAPKTGLYQISMTSDDGMRVSLNHKMILEDWTVHAPETTDTSVELKAGQDYPLEVEYFQAEGGAVAQLSWSLPGSKPFNDAIQAAKRADVIVAVTGISSDQETESHDRDKIGLPAVQIALLKALKALHKPIVEVYVNGSALADPWSKKNIPSILEAWYPGEEGGNSVADVLFGKYNPSGRLPITYPKSIADVPPIADYNMKERTYRFNPPTPLWQFGYGLSYTRFAFSHLHMPAHVETGQGLPVWVTVTNTGHREGSVPVELYIRHLHPSIAMPNLDLRAVSQCTLKPGQSKVVKLYVPARELAVLHEDTTYWNEPEPMRIWVGGENADADSSRVVHFVGPRRLVFWPKAKK